MYNHGPCIHVVCMLVVCREKGILMSTGDIKDLWKSKMSDPG